MVRDLDAARALCEVSPEEERLLESPRRPIVLLRRRHQPGPPVVPSAVPSVAASGPAPSVAPSVAPGNRHLGLLLPYTPLHHMLARALGEPFVLTSGNISDEPIAYLDDEARSRLSGIADAFLTHDRPVHIRTDDSVTRGWRGKEVVLRRSRGFVPQPLLVPDPFRRPLLACGAELKNTFCLAKGRRAFVSHHIGDLENYETLRSFTEGIEHFCRLFDVRPEVVAYDLHPEYLSTKYALELADVDLVGVQHHHAHVASCLVDNQESGPAIGVAFDGLGFGSDGTLWGGEILVADLAGFERAGHLRPVPMPGGTAAIKEPWRMAAGYLDLAFEGQAPGPGGRGGSGGAGGRQLADRHAEAWDAVLALARNGVASPMTLSMGRLFDAVSAIVGVRDSINYEGQAAVEARAAGRHEREVLVPFPHRGWRGRVRNGGERTGPRCRLRPRGGRRALGCRSPLPQRSRWCGRRRLRARPRYQWAGYSRPLRRGVPEPAPGRARQRRARARQVSGCSPTRECPPTTAGSASGKRRWPVLATAPSLRHNPPGPAKRASRLSASTLSLRSPPGRARASWSTSIVLS